MRELGRLKSSCEPFGRDYLALSIPQQCLGTAAYHFTRLGLLCGAQNDSGGQLGAGADRTAALARATAERDDWQASVAGIGATFTIGEPPRRGPGGAGTRDPAIRPQTPS